MAQKRFSMSYVLVTLFGIIMSSLVVSCDKMEDEYLLNTYNNGGEDNNSEIVINVSRDSENGIIEASRIVNGLQQDTTITVALGAVNFEITPVDTIQVASAEVIRNNFAEVGEGSFEEYDENEVYFTKTTRSYIDELDGYSKEITISYLDAYTYVWGKRVEFPAANGSVAVVDEIKEKLGARAVPICLPIGAEDKFQGIVDLIANKAIIYDNSEELVNYKVTDVPAEMADEVATWREKLIEAAAEYDETLMEKFFEDPDSISEDEIIAALRKATIDMSIVPACCGSSFKNKGVQFLLDAVMRYLPSPLDKGAVKGINPRTG